MPVTKDKNRKAEIKECQSQRTRIGRLISKNVSNKGQELEGWDHGMPVTKDKSRKAEIMECQSQRTRVGRLGSKNVSHKGQE